MVPLRSLSDVENHSTFRRAYWLRNFYLLLLITLNLAVMYGLACLRISLDGEGIPLLGFKIDVHPASVDTFLRFGLFVLIQLIIGHYALYLTLKSKNMLSLYPVDESEGQTFGTLTAKELVALVHQVAEELQAGKVRRIAVAKQPDPNAYTAWILGVGNVVVLHSNLLEILPREGVHGVIAHEIGHIRRGDSLMYQALSLPRSLALVLVILAFAKILGGLLESDSVWQFLARTGFLLLAIALATRLFSLLTRLANLASQQTELMVDAYAAWKCGWEAYLNALLIMGDRADVILGFMEVVRKLAKRVNDELTETGALRLLNRLPPREVDRETAVTLAPLIYIVDRLTMMRKRLHVPLSDEQIQELARQAAVKLARVHLDDIHPDEFSHPHDEPPSHKELEARRQARLEEEKKQKEIERNLIAWRDFDRNLSGQLDPHEIPSFIEELRKNPQRMLSRQFLSPESQWLSHPATRHRVLFVYEIFGENAKR